MKCLTVQNGEYIFIVLFLIVKCIFCVENVLSVQELCASNNFKYTISPGEEYSLKLLTPQSAGSISKWYMSKRRCSKIFKTNEASHLGLVIRNMTLSPCSENKQPRVCDCNYFEVTDLSHSEKYCGENISKLYFESKSSSLSIDFYPSLMVRFDVTLIFTAERNSYIVAGYPSDSGIFIETPYFPLPYSSSYRSEYTIQSYDPEAHVQLLFLDFQMSNRSFIEITGNDGSRPTRFYGDIFRPPMIISQANRLFLKFEARDNPGFAGFRAECSFIKYSDHQPMLLTKCGGVKDWHGGSITIQPSEENTFDCIWLMIPPPYPFSQTVTFLSVKIQSLKNVDNKTLLEFREGRYSKSILAKEINCDQFDCNNGTTEEITVAASKGLFVRFRGYMKWSSLIKMTYTYYHVGDCAKHEVTCQNGRCLHSQLKCDGIEHCPNGSDETFCAVTEEIEKPIYHEKKHSGAIASFVLILVVGVLGVVVVIIICTIVWRWRKTLPAVDEQQPLPQIVQEMTDTLPHFQPRLSLHHDYLPSYADFMESSEKYPPLLYTQTTSCVPNNRQQLHTTSFCSHRNSWEDVDVSPTLDPFFESPQPSCSFQDSHIPSTENHLSLKSKLKRSNSLDSKLSQMFREDSYCLFLSITHAVCPDTIRQKIQYNTLPSNFKPTYTKSQFDDKIFKNLDTSTTKYFTSNDYKNRYFSWSFISPLNTDVLTILKTRCSSDPCKIIDFHCSIERGGV